jgi:gamma-glutamylcyclotransferase (GGCT)/AIG2-like uncharacterized protein YtfP
MNNWRDEDQRVFVYGTLRQNGRFHSVFELDSLIATGTVNGRLYDTHAGFPAMTLGNDQHPLSNSERVVGELYLVSPETLQRIDRIESIPYHYTREKILVHTGIPFAYMRSWVYIQDEDHCREHNHATIKNGDWITWHSLEKY